MARGAPRACVAAAVLLAACRDPQLDADGTSEPDSVGESPSTGSSSDAIDGESVSGESASGESASGESADSHASGSSSTQSGSDSLDGSSGSESSESESSESESSTGGLDTQTLTLAYGPDVGQTLDLVLPQPPARASLPIVVLAHGGLWQGGSKASLAQTCTNLVLGSGGALACASIDYRLSDQLGGSCAGGPATYGEQLRDFAAAANLLQDQAEAHGLDRTALFVGGHSAGGHLALSLALRWPALTAACDPAICPAPRGAIGIEGIYDIAAWDLYDQSYWNGAFACATRKAFGDPPGTPSACIDPTYDQPCWAIGSPTHLAAHAGELGLTLAGASLLVHSPDDDWVDFDQALDLGAALSLAFPALPAFVAVDGSCGVGSHDAVLVDPALSACVLAFVASGGTTLAP